MRLINADKSKTEFDFIPDKYGIGEKKYISIKDIKMIIDNAPTAEERPQGEWIDTGSGQECSICKEIQYGYDSFRHFYPNCGADMRGGIK